MSRSLRSVVLGVNDENVKWLCLIESSVTGPERIGSFEGSNTDYQIRSTYLTNARSIFELIFQSIESSVVVFQVCTL